MDATSEVFRGFVFTHRNLLPSVWKALRDRRLPAAGATAWEDPSARGARKRARGGCGGPAPHVRSPTHVILTDRADADTRALAARQHPDAILVTQTWVFDRLAGKPEAPPPESSPPPTSAPSSNPTSLLPLPPPASDDDVLPPDHPNWILDARVSTRAFDASDGVRLGARVGATMDAVERCLRCRHDRDASLNEPVVALLVELERYEHLGGGTAAQRAGDLDAPATRDGRFNEEQSAYARAAAATRAWPRRLKPGDAASELRAIPFVGASLAAQMAQMLETGTCDKLEGFRKGAARGGIVRHHDGRVRFGDVALERDAATKDHRLPSPPDGRREKETDTETFAEGAPGALALDGVRPDVAAPATVSSAVSSAASSAGKVSRGREPGTLDEAAAHASLRVIPGVGRDTARRLILAGIRTREALREDLARGAEGSTARREGLLDARQIAVAERSADLAEPVTAADVEEMREAVLAAVRSANVPGADAAGWEVTQVGGGRRSRASHDADFLVSHPKLRTHASMSTAGALRATLDGLGDRLLSDASAFRMVSVDRARKFWKRVRDPARSLSGPGAGGVGGGVSDYYDKIFGVFRAREGKWRRLDVVFVPRDAFPFALIGWTGSKCFNRLLRNHALNRGMFLNSHCLIRRRDRRCVGAEADDPAWDQLGVPREPPAPPLDARGNDWWPPGWDANRRVESEADVFQLLGLPHVPPEWRDCPS